MASKAALLTLTFRIQCGLGAINALFEIGYTPLLRCLRSDELDG
jgi:hypothetical protein